MTQEGGKRGCRGGVADLVKAETTQDSLLFHHKENQSSVPANQVCPSLPQHTNFGSLMRLAFLEFATSATPETFPKRF